MGRAIVVGLLTLVLVGIGCSNSSSPSIEGSWVLNQSSGTSSAFAAFKLQSGTFQILNSDGSVPSSPCSYPSTYGWDSVKLTSGTTLQSGCAAYNVTYTVTKKSDNQIQLVAQSVAANTNFNALYDRLGTAKQSPTNVPGNPNTVDGGYSGNQLVNYFATGRPFSVGRDVIFSGVSPLYFSNGALVSSAPSNAAYCVATPSDGGVSGISSGQSIAVYTSPSISGNSISIMFIIDAESYSLFTLACYGPGRPVTGNDINTAVGLYFNL